MPVCSRLRPFARLERSLELGNAPFRSTAGLGLQPERFLSGASQPFGGAPVLGLLLFRGREELQPLRIATETQRQIAVGLFDWQPVPA